MESVRKKRNAQIPIAAFLCSALLLAPAVDAEDNVSHPSLRQMASRRARSRQQPEPAGGARHRRRQRQEAQSALDVHNGRATSPPLRRWMVTPSISRLGRQPVRRREEERPSHLVSQDRRVQRCSRIRLSRQSAVHGDHVIVGDILSSTRVHDGANVISVHRRTESCNGSQRWILIPQRSSPDPRSYSRASFTSASLRSRNS